MKKAILSLLILFGFQLEIKSQSLNFTLNVPSCVTGTAVVSAAVTSTPAGTTGYNWMVSGSGTFAPTYYYTSGTSQINIIAGNGNHTVTCIALNGTVAIGASTSNFQFSSLTTINVSAGPSANICSGGSATLVASGATTYTWLPGNLISNSIVVTPSVTTCFSVVGTNGSNCTGATGICINVSTVAPNVAVTPSGNFSICQGSAQMVASGASSYTWSNGFYGASSTATALGCYTVTGANGCGTSSAVVCATGSLTTPPITISGNTLICGFAGGTFSLTGASASAYSSVNWYGPGNITPNTGTLVVITPTATSCYTVVGQNGSCSNTSYICVALSSNAPININPNTGSVCNTGTVNLFASGANTYTWTWGSGNSVGSAVAVTSPGCYTVSGTNNCGIVTNTICISSIVNAPSVNVVASSQSVCANTPVTFTATGASTYSWSTTSTVVPTSTNAIFTTSSNIAGTHCATLTASSMPGCSTYTSMCYVVNNGSGGVTVTQSGATCTGNSATLVASGAQTYTWSNGSVGSAIIVTPSVSTCYSVVGTTSSCAGNSGAVACVSVVPLPVLSVSGNTQICLGAASSLVASGASTYTWSTSQTLANIFVSPISSTCYTVMGSNNFGCVGSKVVCITVQLNPALNISGSTSVCLGTSANLTASGGNTYTWSTGATTSSINILPITNTVVTVSAIGSNGCIGSFSTMISVNTSCSDVWPGDANSDGVVNSTDIIELGLQFSSTGSARTPGGNNYTAQFANNWTGSVSTGKNKSHADCNGDGVVNNSDTVAIVNNFNMTHSFKPASPAADADVQLVTSQSAFYTNYWNTVDIVIGNSNNQPMNLYGLIFDLNFDASLIDANSISLVYTPSAFNNNQQNIEFRKMSFSNGKIFAATVRTDLQTVTGNGKIASLKFKLSENTPDGMVAFSLSNVQQFDNSGLGTTLNPGTVELPLGRDVGVKENNLNETCGFYPNPASNKIVLFASDVTQHRYAIADVTGRLVMEGSFIGKADLDVKTLSEGVYLLRINGSKTTLQQKLIIEK